MSTRKRDTGPSRVREQKRRRRLAQEAAEILRPTASKHAGPLEEMVLALAKREARGAPVQPTWREIAGRLAEELEATADLVATLERSR